MGRLLQESTGKPSITWPESVDEALCFGWIDGIRKSLDESSYTIRFTPRKPTSIWSAINTRRVQHLIKEGLMEEAGLKAFEARQGVQVRHLFVRTTSSGASRAVRNNDEEEQGCLEILSGAAAGLQKDVDLVRAKRKEGRDPAQATQETDRRIGEGQKNRIKNLPTLVQ